MLKIDRLVTAFLLLLLIIILPTACNVGNKKEEKQGADYSDLKTTFITPGSTYGPSCWWWWLNSNVTKEAITRDLEAMHSKGFSGAMIFDAGTELRWGPDENPPNGPMFSSPEWTELYVYALQEAERLGLELGLSIQSGWNLGGPTVTPADTAKKITWTEIKIDGGQTKEAKLPVPESNYDYYRDICVLAYPYKEISRQPISHLEAKSGAKELGGSAPDCRFLLNDHIPVPGEEDAQLKDILDISDKLGTDGTLKWEVPPGQWVVLRIGYTPTDAHVATSSDNWKGRVIDYLSKEAFENYWYQNIDSLLIKAGPMAGTVLKQLETDSWECGGMNWSDKFGEEFHQFNGYEAIKYLPVVCGKIIEDRTTSNAFLADLRKTIAHLVSENHYKTFAEYAAKYGLGIQPESAGPHAAPLDGITNYSHSDIVMSEFWSPSPHRPNPNNRFFVKQAASAAHIYGKQLIGAESFTTVRKPHWGDKLWYDLKPHLDYEISEGLNKVFFHTFTCSPKEMGIPGQEYFAGTHINPQVTWWEKSDPFMDYIKRTQFIAQKGTFVADVLFYYGDHVPNIAFYKGDNQAGSYPGYDYDATNEEVLLKLKVVDAKIEVPSGLQYQILALPDHKVLSLEALKKVDELVHQGATVLGPKPERLVSLTGGEKAQNEFHALANELWGENPASEGQKKIGEGELVWGLTSRKLLQKKKVPFDFEVMDYDVPLDFEYIHYTIGSNNVYFVSNQTPQTQQIKCGFRVSGKQPEIWNPVTGEITEALAFSQSNDRTFIPLELPPFGSCFVFFNEPISKDRQGDTGPNYPTLKSVQKIEGPWEVAFDTLWGGPNTVQLKTLTDWTKNENEGIKYYSGTATYHNSFDFIPDQQKKYWIQLNTLEDVGIAQVQLNEIDMGITWTKPFRIEVTNALKSGQNSLEITVVNSWQNRLIGDRGKEQKERLTKTNIKIRDDWTLRTSGLLGPVEIKSD